MNFINPKNGRRLGRISSGVFLIESESLFLIHIEASRLYDILGRDCLITMKPVDFPIAEPLVGFMDAATSVYIVLIW